MYGYVSEEKAQLEVLNESAGSYIVTYDPIDGNNVLDCNMSVASIFGIWKAKSLDGCTGRDLVGACCTIYGSRTSLIWFNTQSQKVEEYTLLMT